MGNSSMKRKKPKAKPLFDAVAVKTNLQTALCNDLRSVVRPTAAQSFCAERWPQEFTKKFILPSDRKLRRTRTLSKFLAINEEMKLYREFHLPLDDNPSSRVLRMARRVVHYILGDDLDFRQLLVSTRNSGGTSIGVPFEDTSEERKFRYPISSTRRMEKLWDAYGKFDHDLVEAIERMNYDWGNFSQKLVFTAGSRAGTVPKSTEIDRFIAVEPVVNMFFQQGIATLMVDCLRRVGLSIERDPEKHRSMAYQGSVTNKTATIDFSSMSDRVSIGVAKALLPASWFNWLMVVRSDHVIIDDVPVEQHMISTMGNATTFPLETLLLWAIARCATQVVENTHLSEIPDLTRLVNRKVSVFGDDCILPVAAVPLFLDTCSVAGFRVNDTKSFWRDEYFRESCGGDFYHGRDVRPPYLGAFPESMTRITMEAWLYCTLNTVIRKYILYFGSVAYVYDRHLLKVLFSMLETVTNEVKFVPENFPEDSGICFLRDSSRLINAYGLTPAKVRVNKHGQLAFPYLRYIYDVSPTAMDDALRLALHKKKEDVIACSSPDLLNHLRDPDRMLEHWYKRKRRGKYVQAKSSFEVSVTLPSTLAYKTPLEESPKLVEEVRYLRRYLTGSYARSSSSPDTLVVEQGAG